MLFRGDKFSPDEKKDLQTIQKSLRNTSMTLISFFETDFTYDKSYLVRHISGLEDQLKSLVAPHLTEKSVGRVEQIFSVMKTPEFLDSTFVPGQKPEMRPLMAENFLEQFIQKSYFKLQNFVLIDRFLVPNLRK